jgi:hypothetical protein
MKAITPGNSEHFSEDQLYTRSFHSLGVRDLLDARDQFHLHLVHKKNVFATAIGFYLIRNDDPDAGDHAKTAIAAKKRGTYGERTLENSTVRAWSWPCVLAFVTHWQDMSDLRKTSGKRSSSFLVPRRWSNSASLRGESQSVHAAGPHREFVQAYGNVAGGRLSHFRRSPGTAPHGIGGVHCL